MEKNAASECIRAVAAKYGCKILQLYEYNANVYEYNANKTTVKTTVRIQWERVRIRMRTANDSPRIPVHAPQETVDYQGDVFRHRS